MQLLAENAVWNRNIPFLVHYFIALSRVTRPLARISHPQGSMSASCRRGGIPSNWAAHSPAPFRTQHSAEERGFCQNAATGATHSSTPCWIWPWAGDEGMCWNVFQHLPLSSSQSWISYFSFRNRAVVEYAVSPPHSRGWNERRQRELILYYWRSSSQFGGNGTNICLPWLRLNGYLC